jgi:hypothetical protein
MLQQLLRNYSIEFVLNQSIFSIVLVLVSKVKKGLFDNDQVIQPALAPNKNDKVVSRVNKEI